MNKLNAVRIASISTLVFIALFSDPVFGKYSYSTFRSDVCFEESNEVYVVERLTHLSDILYARDLKPLWCENCSVSIAMKINTLANPDKILPGTRIRLPKKCNVQKLDEEKETSKEIGTIIDDAALSANAAEKLKRKKKENSLPIQIEIKKASETVIAPIDMASSTVTTSESAVPVVSAVSSSTVAVSSTISANETAANESAVDAEIRAKIAEEKLKELEEKLKLAEKKAEEKPDSKSRIKKLKEAQAEAAEARAAVAEARAKAAEERARAAELAAKEAERRALEARLNKKPIRVVAMNKMWAEPYFVFNQLVTEGNGIRTTLISDIGLGSRFYLQKNYKKNIDYYVASNLYLINMSETISGTTIKNSLQYSFGLLAGAKYFYTPKLAFMAQTQINRELFVKPPATISEEIEVISGFNYQLDGLIEYNVWNWDQYFATGDARISYYLPTVTASLSTSSGTGFGGGLKVGRKFGWGRIYFDAHYFYRAQSYSDANFVEQVLFLSTGFVYLF